MKGDIQRAGTVPCPYKRCGRRVAAMAGACRFTLEVEFDRERTDSPPRHQEHKEEHKEETEKNDGTE